MTYSLFLHSPSELDIVRQRNVIDCLTNGGLLEATPTNDLFGAGKHLLNFINYLGCSPTLSSGNIECHLRIHSFAHLTGMGGESIESLRYPGCQHVIPAPQSLINRYREETTWTCEKCGQRGELSQINWRRSAGFSTLFIEISPIFPREAMPNDRLLALLESCSHAKWNWFYSRASTEAEPVDL